MLSVGESVSCKSNLGLFRDLMSFKVCSIDLKSLLCELGTAFFKKMNLITVKSLDYGILFKDKISHVLS